MRQIESGGDQATLKTVQGGTPTASLADETVVLRDAKGGTSKVTSADLIQSNGVSRVTVMVWLPS